MKYYEHFQIDELIYNNENIKTKIYPLIKGKSTYSIEYLHGINNVKIFNDDIHDADIVLALDKYIYLYKNKNDILNKIVNSIKKGGYLFIDIFEKEILGIPREHTQYYLDKNNIKHTLTYFNNFVLDTHYNNGILNELVVFKTGEKKLKQYQINLNEDIRKIISDLGLKLIKIDKYNDIEDRKLYIYRK